MEIVPFLASYVNIELLGYCQFFFLSKVIKRFRGDFEVLETFNCFSLSPMIEFFVEIVTVI